MSFCDRTEVVRMLHGKTVALVGSGPGVLDNEPGFIDSHDVVVRTNNYKTSARAGFRCDAYYSFFGGSIKKTAEELKRDGVTLCISKVPNAKFMESEWHRRRGKENGVDFRGIYERRKDWWPCPVYVPTLAEFMVGFNLLGGHIPTTGFAALLDVLSCWPKCVLLTGFDGFASGIHNVDEVWKPGDPTDPIGHAPEREMQWLRDNLDRYPICLDKVLTTMFASAEA